MARWPPPRCGRGVWRWWSGARVAPREVASPPPPPRRQGRRLRDTEGGWGDMCRVVECWEPHWGDVHVQTVDTAEF